MSNIRDSAESDFFFGYFEKRIRYVRENCLDQIEGTILLCCYLDSLSGYCYGGHTGKARLERFLLEHTGQRDIWKKVSLVLLRQHLESKKLPFYSDMISFLNGLGVRMINFNNLGFNPDVDFETLVNKAERILPAGYLGKLDGDIREFEYSAILWRDYRNMAVHETALPEGRAENLAGKKEPFYSNMNAIAGREVVPIKTCFDIPPEFLLFTIESGLDSFRKSVDEGKCTIEVPPVGWTRRKDSRKRLKDDAEVGYPRFITKPFVSLLSGSDYLLGQAQLSHEKWNSLRNSDDRWHERALSRSCVVASVFFLESITISVLRDFGSLEPWQLPFRLQKKTGLHKRDIDYLPLIERVFLIPYLCADAVDALSREYFDRGSEEFKRMKELIEIRDSFAHSRPVRLRVTITKTGEREFVLDDKFEENFWPLTRMPKDISRINHSHAKLAREIVERVVMHIDEFLGGKLTKNYWMTEERMEFDPEILSASDSCQDEPD